MSEAPQGPSWFQATDGKWYPPPEGQQNLQSGDQTYPEPQARKLYPVVLGFAIPILIVSFIAGLVVARMLSSNDEATTVAVGAPGEIFLEPAVEVGPDPITPTPVATSPVPDGVDVEFVQTLLNVAGLQRQPQPLSGERVQPGGPIVSDGVFGPLSAAAASEFQRSVGLAETGGVDDATWQRLLGTTSEYTVVTSCEDGWTSSRPVSFTFCGEGEEYTGYEDFTWDAWSPLGATGRGVLTCFESLCDRLMVEMELSGAQELPACGDGPPSLEFTTAIVVITDGGVTESFTLDIARRFC
tara:strand:- start:193 stop:1086 length:894 start_codon:yes stop_codon:yes gene_type:complete